MNNQLNQTLESILNAVNREGLHGTQIIQGDYIQNQQNITVQSGATFHNHLGSTDICKPLAIPRERDYNGVRYYIEQRCKTDADFKERLQHIPKTQLAKELTEIFGWKVDDFSLRANLNKHP